MQEDLKQDKDNIKEEELVKEADKLKENPQYYPIKLSPNEKAYLCDVLLSAKKGRYLEFGSGGSTFLAILHAQVSIVSVESDKNWLKHLQSWRVIAEALQNKRLTFCAIDIGAVGKWGIPQESHKKALFPHYSAQVFRRYKRGGGI